MENCSLSCQQQHGDILGAPQRTVLVAIEIQVPWPRQILDAADLPIDLATNLKKLIKLNKGLTFLGMTPPPALQQVNKRWLIIMERHREGFRREHYHLDEDKISTFLESRFDAGSTNTQMPITFVGGEDVFVCVHGARDDCCGVFGSELLEQASNRWSKNHRFWATSHIGGHKYAPTLITLSDGRVWGHVTIEDLATILEHSSHPATMIKKCYRGWSFLEGLVQHAERELFQRFGWAWFKQSPTLSDIQIEKFKDHTIIQWFVADKHFTFQINEVESLMMKASCTAREPSKQRQYRLKEIICT